MIFVEVEFVARVFARSRVSIWPGCFGALRDVGFRDGRWRRVRVVAGTAGRLAGSFDSLIINADDQIGSFDLAGLVLDLLEC